MNKWQKEVMQSLLDSEEATISELETQYKRALKDITEKVKAFQADIDLLDAAMNQDGIDDATKELLKSQKRSKIYQKQYQEAMKAQVGGILDKMHSDQYTTIDRYLRESYDDAYVGTLYDIAQQGIPVITPINQAAAVQAILTDSKISKGLYSALGVSVEGLKKTITQEISRGIASGLFYKDIARNISNVSGSGYSNAKRIVVTEGNRIQNTASRNAALDAKDHGADLVKIWDATLDGKTRESHKRVDGEIRELDEKFSNGLDRPGDPSGEASEVVNCRCKEIHKPRWDIDGGFAKRDNATGEILTFESPKDYQDFKEKYWSKENQDYMNHVSSMEQKYGTKKFDKLLDSMNEKEYLQLKIYENANPMLKNSGADSRDKLDKIDIRSTTKTKHGFTAFSKYDPLYERAKKVEPDGNKFDVSLHGSQTAVAFGGHDSNMSPKLLANVIKHSEWDGKQPIRLLSCNTGLIINDNYCFAEELANALGVVVEAPNDLIFINKDGIIRVGKTGKGNMIKYKPNERKRLK